MDEFTRMMLRDGVVPTSEKSIEKTRKSPPPVEGEPPASEAGGQTDTTTPHSWATGNEARRTAQVGLDRMVADRMKGKRAWLTLIKDDGKALTVERPMTIGQLMVMADRERIRLITVGGDGWSCIMHPLAGTATIELDPVGDPE